MVEWTTMGVTPQSKNICVTIHNTTYNRQRIHPPSMYQIVKPKASITLSHKNKLSS